MMQPRVSEALSGTYLKCACVFWSQADANAQENAARIDLRHRAATAHADHLQRPSGSGEE